MIHNLKTRTRKIHVFPCLRCYGKKLCKCECVYVFVCLGSLPSSLPSLVGDWSWLSVLMNQIMISFHLFKDLWIIQTSMNRSPKLIIFWFMCAFVWTVWMQLYRATVYWILAALLSLCVQYVGVWYSIWLSIDGIHQTYFTAIQ